MLPSPLVLMSAALFATACPTVCAAGSPLGLSFGTATGPSPCSPQDPVPPKPEDGGPEGKQDKEREKAERAAKAEENAKRRAEEMARFEERMKTRKEGKPKSGWVVTSRYGFEMRAPKKWTQIPIQTEEEWLAAKFQCDREYLYNNKEIGWSFTHRPEMLVIAFPKAAMKKRGKEVKEEETDEGTEIVTVSFNNPYRDYDDFLDRTYNSSGFYKADETRDEVDGLVVIKRLYKAEKLSNAGPKHIITWLYQDEDVEYALQTEVMEDVVPKLEKLIESCYRSFGLIKRDGLLDHAGKTQDQRVFRFRDLNSGEPKERRSRRMESEAEQEQRAIAKLPPEWKHEKKGRVMVLSNADDKWTQRVITHSNNLLKWLDERFGLIGPEEYVRAPIIRICANSEEENSFRRGVDTGGGWSWSTSDAELVTSQDDSGWAISYEVDALNREILDFWLREKNAELQMSMPDWIQDGLYEAIEGARMDGRSPSFRKDFWDLESFREAERNGTLTDPKDLFVMTSADFNDFSGSASGFWNRRAECQILVSFLISDDAKRVRQAKDLIETYLTNLIAVLSEAEAEFAGDLRKQLETTEDEEEEAKAVAELRGAMKKRERTILERTFERTFGGWSTRDWDAFTKGMRASF
ncbi:MAG: hypothetical protein R3F49_16900 [Planctomycetota bacterium]